MNLVDLTYIMESFALSETGTQGRYRDCVEGLASVERLTWAILWWNLPSPSLILPREPKGGDPMVMISGTGQEMDP